MIPGLVLGRYTIEAFIGGGAFGRVYRATQAGPAGFARTVALKVLRPDCDDRENSVQVFAREARIVALLHHRNIVQVYDFSCEGDQYYLVMELIDGLTLRGLLRGRSVLPLWLRVAIGAEVCRGLSYAHALCDEQGQPLGVVHRDIKPSNILVGRRGEVKVSDFGLAKMSRVPSDQLTVAGMIKGTPGYMSPEQRRGEAATPASDVFSLGAMLYEMCTQVPASIFWPEGAPQPRLQIPSRGNPEISPELDRSLLAALSSHAERRPASAALAEQLQQVALQLEPAVTSRLAEELGRCVEHELGPENLGTRPATMQVEPHPLPPGVREAPTLLVPGAIPPLPVTASGAPGSSDEERGSLSLGSSDEERRSLSLGSSDEERGPASLGSSDERRDAELDLRRTSERELERRRTLLHQPGPGGTSVHAPALGDTGDREAELRNTAPREGERRQPTGDDFGPLRPFSLPPSELERPRSERRRWAVVIGAIALAAAAGGLAVRLARVGSTDPEVTPETPRLDLPALHQDSAPPATLPPDSGPDVRRSEADLSPAEPPLPPVDLPHPRRHGKKPKRSASATGSGFLSVNSAPWAHVFVDGKQVGTTPLFRLSIPVGTHQLRLTTPDGRGASRRVTIRRDGHLNLGKISLDST